MGYECFNSSRFLWKLPVSRTGMGGMMAQNKEKRFCLQNRAELEWGKQTGEPVSEKKEMQERRLHVGTRVWLVLDKGKEGRGWVKLYRNTFFSDIRATISYMLYLPLLIHIITLQLLAGSRDYNFLFIIPSSTKLSLGSSGTGLGADSPEFDPHGPHQQLIVLLQSLVLTAVLPICTTLLLLFVFFHSGRVKGRGWGQHKRL